MIDEKHISSEEAEQEIIRIANSFPALKHDYDDCGHLNGSANEVEQFVVPLENQSIIDSLPKDKYLDGLLSLQANKTSSPEDFALYSSFFNRVNNLFDERKIHFCKGETTFISGRPYAVLALTREDAGKAHLAGRDKIILGTIDSYVEGKHFRMKNNTTNSGFYASLAAISDIGANGGTPLEIYLMMINPSRKRMTEFMNGVEEAAKFFRIKQVHTNETRNPDLGEFAAAITITGEVEEKKEMTLKGLEEGMKLYVAGRAGISKANDYFMIREHLEYNLSPQFRQSVFDAISSKTLCNDVSDGVDKSLRNLLRHSKGLDIAIDESKLMKTGYNPFHVYATLDDIKYGGDDYCLVIATNSELAHIAGVQELGRVEKGEGKVKYS